MQPKGQLAYHRSRLDTELQPIALCATDDGTEPKALIVELSPGTIANLPGSIARCERLAGWAREGGASCVVIKPGQRGPGSVGQGPAEVDVLEAIEWACRNFPIDRDRISVMGGSMGGAATWYLASHYPDLFAAAAPFCGYCDYGLWIKPGGHIMRTLEWEHFSWQNRGAAFRVENLANLGLWITHGEWDASIGGGVPVQHSRQMVERLQALGAEPIYSEVPQCGHGCMTDETTPRVVQWLCRQRRRQCPEEVHLVAHTLRHNRAFWACIEQFETYGRPARAHARIEGHGLRVTTENVRRLALGPLPGAKEERVVIDSDSFSPMDLSERTAAFEKADGSWELAEFEETAEKRHGVSGPIGDMFFEPQRFIFGTRGPERETFILEQLSGRIPGFFKKFNGGVHRGVFAGESWHALPVVKDDEITDDEIVENNLMLYGSFDSNAVLRQFRKDLPLEVSAKGVTIAGREFEGHGIGFTCIFPHPANPDRYLAVTGGNTPEALAGCSHLHLQLLPDYLVWRGVETWWGFFGNDWR